MFNTDPDRSTDEILDDIKHSSIDATNNKNTALVVAPFAALLVQLSREASETADKNIRLQKGMMWITAMVLVLTIAQLWMAFSPRTNQATLATPQTHISTPHKQGTVPNKQIDVTDVPTVSPMPDQKAVIPHLNKNTNAPKALDK